jgi:hypothetical protein
MPSGRNGEVTEDMKRAKEAESRTLVSETGAQPQDVLIGAYKANEGLRIVVSRRQKWGRGGRIEGSFQLVACGRGPYAASLKSFEGTEVESAKWLIERVRQQPDGKKCTHIFNLNMLFNAEGDRRAAIRR